MATESSDSVTATYADFVQKYGRNGYNGYKESCWLMQFLRHGYSTGSELLDRPIEIHILDSTNGILNNSLFTAHRATLVEPRFLETLHSSSSQRRTRLIMLQCQRLRDVNELYIDAIGLRYRLDPHFFSALF
jgi:hypothetical protein